MIYPARRLMNLAAVAGAASVAMTMAACGGDPPPGVDGDLADGWAGLAEPVVFAPDPQVCHEQPFQQVAPLVDYAPVTCEESHLLETFHVGAFPADLDEPPAADSDPYRGAYRECEEQATEYLGGDFRQGRLWLGVAVPAAAGWEGGARWFRCDLVEVESVYGDPVPRQATLAGALAGDGEPPLRLGCYQVTVEDSEVTEMAPVGCDESHEAEFVGAWRAPGGAYPDPSDSDAEALVYEGCREQVAAYVDVPADGDLQFRTGAIADWMSESEWRAGDRAFRCYLWLPGRELTESLAGAGTDALPIQTE
jgi:hypothetical protein